MPYPANRYGPPVHFLPCDVSVSLDPISWWAWRLNIPMTKTNMDLSELLAKHDQGDLLLSIAETVPQLIMEEDVYGLIGARRHERSGERTT